MKPDSYISSKARTVTEVSFAPKRSVVGIWVLVVLMAGVYTALATYAAWRRPFWNDELLTYYVTSRPSFREVWQMLLTTCEQSPPLFYVITRASVALFGLDEVALRLPAILGVATAAVSVALLVGRSVPRIYGAAAGLFFLTTSAYEYSLEARPYGLLLAFSGLALLAWQRATDGRQKRAIWICVLALFLLAAFQTHYYAVLLLVPLGAGELTRAHSRRRVDTAILAAILIPALSLLLLAPLATAAKQYNQHFWAPAHWAGAPRFYLELLDGVVLCLMLAGIGAHIWLSRDRTLPPSRIHVPKHLVVTMATLSLLPFFGVLMGKTVTGVFTPRYVLPAAIGISVLAGWGLERLVRLQRTPAVAAICLLLVCYLSVAVRKDLAANREHRTLQRDVAAIASTDSSVPMAIADPHVFFVLSHYAPSALKPRLFYLADAEIAARRVGANSAELGLITFRPWAPLRVLDFRAFEPSHRDFFLYGTAGQFAWLLPEMMADRQRMELASVYDGQLIFHAAASPSMQGQK